MSGELKDIAVILDGADPLADSVVAGLALRLAHHHGARLTAFERAAAEAFDEPLWAEDVSAEPYASIEFCGLSGRADTERFTRLSPIAALRREARHTGAWSKHADLNDILEHVRCTDLVVVGSPLGTGGWSAPDAGDIILRAGRPALVMPRKFAQRHPTQRKVGHRVLVAWNGSAPAARAVHDALPFLRLAEEITLLFVNPQTEQQPGRHLLTAIAEHLRRHGVNVRPEVAPSRDAEPARVILDRLAELDINLLVMGAFSRSRLSETWFGGASEDLLHQVAVPILTAH